MSVADRNRHSFADELADTGVLRPAARVAVAGELVIVLTYCAGSDEEARLMKPTVIVVDEQNRPLAK